MRKNGFVILLGLICAAFQQICLADTCMQISEKLAGEWQFDKTHTIKFEPGKTYVALDGKPAAMSLCDFLPESGISFAIDNRQMVIIDLPMQLSGGTNITIGTSGYELTPLASASPSPKPESTRHSIIRPQSFVARYSQGKSEEFRQLTKVFQQTQFLEGMADALSDGISLPKPVTLTIDECGYANAFFSPQRQSITVCSELIQELIEGIPRDLGDTAISPQEIDHIFAGGLGFILMHEVGHALIYLLDLPVLGREEDAADQIGTYFLLHSNKYASSGLAGALWFFREKSSEYTRTEFSDEHALGPQRQSNLACWAFGKDPARYEYLLVGGFLTKERAERCSHEYMQLDATIHKLIGKNIRS